MSRIAAIQARMGSSRLPGKVMALVQGRPMIALLVERLRRARHIDEIVLATTDHPSDDRLAAFVASLGVRVHRGSEQDVLARMIGAVGDATTLVRITADCPFTDPEIVEAVCEAFDQREIDYASNVDPPTFPDGLDVEVVLVEALRQVAREESEVRFREHVTLAIRERPGFRRLNIPAHEDLSRLRWTVDEPADLEVARRVFGRFHPRIDFSWREVLRLWREEPALFAANAGIPRNEGMRLPEQIKRARARPPEESR